MLARNFAVPATSSSCRRCQVRDSPWHRQSSFSVCDAYWPVVEFLLINPDKLLFPSGDGLVFTRSFTWRGHHPLPLLEQGRFQTVARTQRVGLVTRHQLLHRLQYYT